MAAARPRCLYCGAALAADLLPAATASVSAAPESAPAPVREADGVLLVLDLGAADAESVARALGLSVYEAGLRVRRGGHQLHRIARAEEAEAEADRLAALGLAVDQVPEAEARAAAEPVLAQGGRRSGEDAIELRGADLALRLESADLLIVVCGPITREYQAAQRRVQTATLDLGYRLHLHRLADPRPVELDPRSFVFDAPPAGGSSLLELTSWVDALARGVRVDDGFRRLPPALAPAAPEEGSLTAALGPLVRGTTARKDEGPLVLDNLGQFRFYSGWRAAVERRRRVSG